MENEQRLDDNRPYPGLPRFIRTPKKRAPSVSNTSKTSDEKGNDFRKKGRCNRIELPNAPWLFPQG